jgi:plastocyanin
MPNGVGTQGLNLNFSPVKATVIVGVNNTIIFEDNDTAAKYHNVDFSAVPSGSTVTLGTTSPNLTNNQSWTVILTTPGTYTYACDYHSWMRGTIVVLAAP